MNLLKIFLCHVFKIMMLLLTAVTPLSAANLQTAPNISIPSVHQHANFPLSINLQNIPLRQALQLFANFVGINIVIHESVNGAISIQLKDLPWNQALDIILIAQGLKKQEVNDIWFIEKQSSASESQKNKKISKLRQSLIIRVIQLHYAKAEEIANAISQSSHSLLSKYGTMGVDKRTNTVWLQDTQSQIKMITSLINDLDKPHAQVMIEARIVNMSRHCTQDLGIRFGVQSSRISGTLAGANKLIQGTSPTLIPLSERLNLDFGAIPLDASPASIGIALAKLGDHVLLDLELSALESEGLAEIIASPRLLTRINSRL